MKKVLPLLFALAMPVLAVASESEYPDTSATELQSEENVSREAEGKIIPQPLPYCWDLDRTSCTSVGATRGCQDGIYFDYVCTCRQYSGTPRYWDCPEVR